MKKFDERLTGDAQWFGYLTLENVDAVADRIRRMLDGHRYTWVAVNEAFERPEVRTSQVMEKVEVFRSRDDSYGELAGITVLDTYGVWGPDTTAPDERTAAQQPERDRAYMVIDHNKIEIKHFVPAGSRLYWVIALEDEGGEPS